MADKKEAKVSETKVSKAELKTTSHELIRNVNIGGEIHKKGTSYSLTETGRKYFKKLNYIK